MSGKVTFQQILPPHNRPDIAEIAHSQVIIRKMHLQLPQHIFVSGVILIEKIFFRGIAINVPFRDILHKHLPVFRKGVILPVIIQSSGNRALPSIQIFDLPVNRAVLFLKKLFDAFRISFIQLLADLLEGHAVILHILNHIQPR